MGKVSVRTGVVVIAWLFSVWTGRAANIVAAADSYSTTQNVALAVPAPGILVNDTGSNRRALLASNPTNGTLTLSTNGAFAYTPKADYLGTDRFTYKVISGSATSSA